MSVELAMQCIVLGVMIVLAIVGNIGVCWITYNTRNSEPITAMLMMNMAVTDLLKGVMDMPFVFITLVSADVNDWLLGDTVCQMTAFVGQTLCLASTLSVACVSIDRYCTIVHAFYYQTMMTQRRAKLMLVLTWLVAAIISLMPVCGVGLYRFLPATHHCSADWTHSPVYSLSVLVTGVLLPLVITSFCHFRIFRAARSQSRRVDVLSPVPRGGDGASGGVGGGRRIRPGPHRRVWRPPRHRAHAAKIILAIFGSFFCCWTVYVAVHIWNFILFEQESRSAWSEVGKPATDPYSLNCWWITVVTFVAFAPAVISPYVSTLLNRRMRKTLRKLLMRLCCPAGRVDYRRSTIAFATNIDGRGRSARQRMLIPRAFGHRNQWSDEFQTSELVRRGSCSRSNRDDSASVMNAPLDAFKPIESSYSAWCSGTSSSASTRGPMPRLTNSLEVRNQTGTPVWPHGGKVAGLQGAAITHSSDGDEESGDSSGCEGTASPLEELHGNQRLPSHQAWDTDEGGSTPERPRGTRRLSPLVQVTPKQSREPGLRQEDGHLPGANLKLAHKKILRFQTTKQTIIDRKRGFRVHTQRIRKGPMGAKDDEEKEERRTWGESVRTKTTLTETKKRRWSQVRYSC